MHDETVYAERALRAGATLAGVLEAARFGFLFEFLEPFRQAMKAERVQLFECRVSEHGISS